MVWKVQETIKQMTPLKVPSPDGMPFLFYQTYLNFIGDDVSQSILNFHNLVTLPAHLNHTFITLILRLSVDLLIFTMYLQNLFEGFSQQTQESFTKNYHRAS